MSQGPYWYHGHALYVEFKGGCKVIKFVYQKSKERSPCLVDLVEDLQKEVMNSNPSTGYYYKGHFYLL